FDDFLRIVHPDDRAAVAEAFARSAREGAGLNVEFRAVLPGGAVRWIRDQADVVRDPEGRPVSLTGACVDITERKQKEEELRRARDELGKRVEERTAELRQAERLAAI